MVWLLQALRICAWRKHETCVHEVYSESCEEQVHELRGWMPSLETLCQPDGSNQSSRAVYVGLEFWSSDNSTG